MMGIDYGSKPTQEMLYAQTMGAKALLRQQQLAKEARECNCQAELHPTRRAAVHAPGCPRAKRPK